jgi:hypothetical protein
MTVTCLLPSMFRRSSTIAARRRGDRCRRRCCCCAEWWCHGLLQLYVRCCPPPGLARCLKRRCSPASLTAGAPRTVGSPPAHCIRCSRPERRLSARSRGAVRRATCRLRVQHERRRRWAALARRLHRRRDRRRQRLKARVFGSRARAAAVVREPRGLPERGSCARIWPARVAAQRVAARLRAYTQFRRLCQRRRSST